MNPFGGIRSSLSSLSQLGPLGFSFLTDSLRLRLGRRPRKPFIAGITINTVCNLRCSYCFIGRESEHFPDGFSKQGLPTEEVKQILANIRRDTAFLIITGGEPFLRPDLEELLQYAKRTLRFANISIATNGLFLAKRLSCLSFVDRLGISYDFTRAREYPKQMSSLLDTLLELKREGCLPPLHFTMTLLRNEDLSLLNEFCDYCSRSKFRIWLQPERDHGDFTDWDWFVATAESMMERYGSRLFLNDLRTLRSFREGNPSRGCYPELRLHVKEDGRLSYPCHKLEHLFDSDSLTEVSATEAWRQAESKFGTFPNQQCGDCGFTCYFETAGLYRNPLHFLARGISFMFKDQGAAKGD